MQRRVQGRVQNHIQGSLPQGATGWEEKHKLSHISVYIEVKRLHKLKILIQEKKKQCKTEYRKECKQVYK